MANPSADNLRTIGIVAHVDAGKTTLTERILFETGARPSQGSVDDGTAATDWMRQEQERGISIQSAAVQVGWEQWGLQILDTPGHVDFSAEVARCFRVLDGVVVVLDGVRGVESQTRMVWQRADRWRCARIVFVNKMDRPSADFPACMRSIREILGGNPVAIAVPLFDGHGRLLGIGDVVRGSVSALVDAIAEPDAERMRQELQLARELLVEACAEQDDALLELVLSGAGIPEESLVAALRRQTISGTIIPVVAGSALLGAGVDILLDAVGELLPSLGDRERDGVEAFFPVPQAQADLRALVFKVDHTEAKTNAYIRVFEGRIERGDRVWCSGSAAAFEIADLWVPQAERRLPVSAVSPGEIAVLVVPASVRTGDTLVATPATAVLPGCEFPSPVISVLLEPAEPGALPSVRAALDCLQADDPTLQVATDAETGLPLIAGLGELHLEIVAERVREKARCELRRSRPRVAVRLRLLGVGVGHAVAGNAGAGAAGAVADVRVRPGAEGAGCTVEVGDHVPERFAERAKDIAAGWLQRPGRLGGEIVDAVVRVERLEQDLSVELGEAGAGALEDALGLAVRASGHAVLEPRVHFRVTAPEESGSVVLADLQVRKAQIREMQSGRLGAIIEGEGFLRAFLGYTTRLRSLTKGLGEVDLVPAGFGADGSDESSLAAQN